MKLKNLNSAMKTLVLTTMLTLACLFTPAPAQAQNGYKWTALLTDSTLLNTNSATTITNTAVDLYTRHGAAVLCTFSSLAGDTNVVRFNFGVSLDKTNYATASDAFTRSAIGFVIINNTTNSQLYATNWYTDILTVTARANGTNVVRVYKNFGPEVLDNGRKFKLLSADSSISTNLVTVTRVEVGQGY
jgi:hypothetical protein